MSAQLETDLSAVAANVRSLRERTDATLMAVVKADGFGGGIADVARTAVASGAAWLGVAGLDEARALRAAGLREPVLSWLNDPADDLSWALRQDVDVAVTDLTQLATVVDAARRTRRSARIHLHVDCGMAREGCPTAAWPTLCGAARHAELHERVQVVGVMGHLAMADVPGHPENARGRELFAAAVLLARSVGLAPEHRHLAATAATLHDSRSHHTMVRVGAGLVGIDPAGGTDLRPALRLTAPLLSTRSVDAGTAVGYGRTWRAGARTRLGLVGIGYADGVPRAASGRAQVLVQGRRRPVVGRISMDQLVVSLGDLRAAEGEQVTVFGPGDAGEPRLEDWALWADTIPHEIATRVGPRVRRSLRSQPVRLVS